MICKKCIHEKVCKHKSKSVYECEHFADGTIKNQYDRIRNMSIEEMAEFMQYCGWDYPPYCSYLKIQSCDQNCLKCAKEWLETEVTE
jgi:hypothetical protein